MGRSKPTVITQRITSDDKCTQLILNEEIFCVLYDGKLFTLKSFNAMVETGGPYYKKPVFNTAARAKQSAKELNTFFMTDKFTFARMTVDTNRC